MGDERAVAHTAKDYEELLAAYDDACGERDEARRELARMADALGFIAVTASAIAGEARYGR